MKDSTPAPSFYETFYNGYNANIIFVEKRRKHYLCSSFFFV